MLRDRRAAELVDRLVVVAADGDVAVCGKELQQLELGVVRVLELVDEDGAEPPLGARQDRGVLAKQAQRKGDEVAEVDEPVFEEQPLVGGVRSRELGLARDVVGELGLRAGRRAARRELRNVGRVLLWGHILIFRPREEGEDRAKVVERVSEWAKPAKRKLEQMLLEKDRLFGLGEDAIVGRQSEQNGVLPHKAVAERMKGSDVGLDIAVGDEAIDALFHLRGRTFRERQCEDLRRLDALLCDEPRDAARDDRRLARAHARNDEERSVGVRDGLPLPLVQIGQEIRGAPPQPAGRPVGLLYPATRIQTKGEAVASPFLIP